MSNEVIDMSAFKTAAPSKAFQQMGRRGSLAEGIGSSYGVLGYKGKNWTLKYRGVKYPFLRPDDGTPIGYIDVVILRSPPHKSKSYYAGYDPGSSDGEQPICASLNGVVPDVGVQQQQAQVCALCPRNAWKVDATGRKSRECSDYKRLAVLLMPNQTKPMLGAPLMEPVFLRVPPASLNGLAVMGETMERQGWDYSAFITRISFDPNEPHPKMVFRPIRGLTDEEAPAVIPLIEDPTSLRIVGDDQQTAAVAPQVQQIIPPQGAPPQQQFFQQPPPQRVDPSPPTLTLLPEVPINSNTTVPPASVTVQATPMQTAADVGEPEESDAALDERIANLMKSM